MAQLFFPPSRRSPCLCGEYGIHHRDTEITKWRCWFLICWLAMAASLSAAEPGPVVIVVRGASGADEYGRQFDRWTERWIGAAQAGSARIVRIGPRDEKPGAETAAGEEPDRERLKKALAACASEDVTELWLVFNGHGTFDGRSARFNLQGPDVSAEELSEWLRPVACPTAAIHCGASSGPFLKLLAAPHRVVITATKSGSELNFARFGEHLSEAIGSQDADLDKDGQTSLFEAFLAASRRTNRFYETEGRLITEHALLDDTGDGSGIRSDQFRGLRPVPDKDGSIPALSDGRRAHQFHLVRSREDQQLDPALRRERDRLELAVIALRERKGSFASEDDYYARLEVLLVQLAEAGSRRSAGR